MFGLKRLVPAGWAPDEPEENPRLEVARIS